MTQFAPQASDARSLLSAAEDAFKPQDWMPCNKIGCCTGDAWCCKHAMSASITWLEAEQLWLAIKDWSVEDRRQLLSVAKQQFELIKAQDPSLFDDLENTEIQNRDGLNRITAAVKSADAPCPLLGDQFECRVYNNRPLICRGFGCTAHVRNVSVPDENGNPKDDVDIFVNGCDDTMAAVMAKQAEDPNMALPVFTRFEKTMYQLAAPSKRLHRAPLITKHIQFWILDLADESGDLTNPYNVFETIRDWLETGLGSA